MSAEDVMEFLRSRQGQDQVANVALSSYVVTLASVTASRVISVTNDDWNDMQLGLAFIFELRAMPHVFWYLDVRTGDVFVASRPDDQKQFQQFVQGLRVATTAFLHPQVNFWGSANVFGSLDAYCKTRYYAEEVVKNGPDIVARSRAEAQHKARALDLAVMRNYASGDVSKHPLAYMLEPSQ